MSFHREHIVDNFYILHCSVCYSACFTDCHQYLKCQQH